MQVVDEPRADGAADRGGAPDATESRRGDAARPRWGRELPLVALVLSALAAAIYRVWERPWTTPFVHAGDSMAHLALLETVGWTGTPAPSDALGAPLGVDWADMPVGADRLHLVVLRLLRAVTGGTVPAANAYLLVSIVAVGVVSYAVLRSLRCSPLSSGVAAVVFAVAPAQFVRAGVGHLFLANYVAVPIGVWLALWASAGTGRSARGWRDWLVPAVGVVVLGSASAYYAVFGVVAIVSVGLVRALRVGSWRAGMRPLGVAAATMAVVVANVAGEAVRRGGDAGVRVPLDSDAYGLRLAQMLLPIRDHRIAVLSDWADRAFRVAAPGDRGAALGLLSVLGLVAVLAWCVRWIGRPAGGSRLLDEGIDGRSGVLARLGVVAVSAIAVGTVGGLGMVGATLGITQIRAWSRIGVVVGFVGVAGLAMLLDGLSRRWGPSRPLRYAVAVVLVGVAVLDQVGTAAIPSSAETQARWDTDRALAADLQASLPDGAVVFQLPVGTYPAELPIGSISANDLLAPQVAGDGSLRWSVGAMSGRGGDWQRSESALPTDELLTDLAAAGVSAVSVDRRGLDQDADLEAELESEIGPPAFESDDGTRAWFDLRPLRQELVAREGEAAVVARGALVTRPLGVVVEGSPGVRSTLDPRARDVAATSAIVVTDESVRAGGDERRPISVSFTLAGEPGASVQVSSPDGPRRIVELRDEPIPLTIEVRPDLDGVARIELRTDAAPLPPPAGDWGDLRLRIADLSVRDAALAR